MDYLGGVLGRRCRISSASFHVVEAGAGGKTIDEAVRSDAWSGGERVDSGEYESAVEALLDLTGKMAKANPAHLDALFPLSKESIERWPAEQSPMYREWASVWSRMAADGEER